MGPTVTMILCGALLGACADQRAGAPRPKPKPPALAYATGTVVFLTNQGEVPIRVQVADTDEKRGVGLMHRKSMAADKGMLFLFPEQRVQTFWMRNTYIPLDMIFVNTQRVVVGVVENAKPLTESPRSVWRPARYIVEVNAHLARINGIGPGTRVRIEGVQSPLLRSP